MANAALAVPPAAASAAAPPAIELIDVSKTYRTRRGATLAIDRLDLAVGRHEFVTVVGPSGCGKSTILKMIAGLVAPSSGEVRQYGIKVVEPTPNVGMVFQAPVLMKWRNVIDNVLFTIDMLGLGRRGYEARARELLTLAGLGQFLESYPKELSGGMQQRAALCRALIHDPPLLLMDEPFGALDAMTRDAMNVELMHIWSETKKATLLITHSIMEAVFLADRVVVMSGRPGRVVAVVTIDLPRPRRPGIRLSKEFVAKVKEVSHHLGVATD